MTPVACPTAEQPAAIVTAVRKELIRRICRTSGLGQEAALPARLKKVDKPKKKNCRAACLARIFEVYPLLCHAFQKGSVALFC